MTESRKVGLALGSGAARGWSHVGVIHALEEAGVQIDVVAGTSMGSLVGGAYAADCLDDIENIARSLDWKDFLYYFSDIAFAKAGMVDGGKIAAFLRKQFKWPLIEQMALPFAAVAADVNSGEQVVFRDGDVIEAIRASISMPGVFSPVEWTKDGETRVLVDGGIVNPIPVSVAREMGADFVIAVDINHDMTRQLVQKHADERQQRQDKIVNAPILKGLESLMSGIDLKSLARDHLWGTRHRMPRMVEVLGNSVRIMEQRIGEGTLKADPPELLIRPVVGDVDYMEFHRVDETIAAGYEAAQAALPDLKRALAG